MGLMTFNRFRRNQAEAKKAAEANKDIKPEIPAEVVKAEEGEQQVISEVTEVTSEVTEVPKAAEETVATLVEQPTTPSTRNSKKK